MSIIKELGSKQKKKFLSSIYAPGISKGEIKKNIQYHRHDEKKGLSYLFDFNQKISFFSNNDKFLPSLVFIRKYKELDIPSVQVDEGAVKFVINGADIFTQGIVSTDRDFEKNTIVIVLNPQKAALSVGHSIMNSFDLQNKKGKGIVNLHFLGDKIWEGDV